MKRTTQYTKIICALLTKPSITAAAKALGMPTKSVYNILGEPEFISQFEQAQENLIMQTTGYLAANLSSAMTNIVEIMSNKNYPVQTRLNAARTILEYSCKFTELSQILPRIKKLEQECGLSI